LNARIRQAVLFHLVCAALATLPAKAQQLVTVPVTPVDLPVGRSLPLQTAVPITRVSIATPEVADVIVISERELVINSLKSGETDAIVWLSDGTRTHYRISVHSPSDRMQIAIAVKIAEVRRDALRLLGLSGYYRDKDVRVGSGIFRSDNVIDKESGAISIPSTANFLTVLSDLGTDKVLAFLEAEEQKGNARLLAEPNLLAGNKDTASFLAGGELPIPIFQPGQQGGGGQVVVQYREFGVRLGFRGEIVSDSLIKLQLIPEVSSLDYANAITLQGFRIPALRTRRVNTTLDVRKDQSLVVSGLFTGEEESVRTGIPFLKDIPILGALFSSSRFQRNETELLVIVTPMIVNPMSPRALDVLRFVPDTARPAMDALKKRLPPKP
jgi:pilus assembly protein CpaC